MQPWGNSSATFSTSAHKHTHTHTHKHMHRWHMARREEAHQHACHAAAEHSRPAEEQDSPTARHAAGSTEAQHRWPDTCKQQPFTARQLIPPQPRCAELHRMLERQPLRDAP